MGDADATNSNYSIVYFVGYVWLYYLGKLQYFTNLNLAAIWGWFPGS